MRRGTSPCHPLSRPHAPRYVGHGWGGASRCGRGHRGAAQQQELQTSIPEVAHAINPGNRKVAGGLELVKRPSMLSTRSTSEIDEIELSIEGRVASSRRPATFLFPGSMVFFSIAPPCAGPHGEPLARLPTRADSLVTSRDNSFILWRRASSGGAPREAL